MKKYFYSDLKTIKGKALRKKPEISSVSILKNCSFKYLR